MVRHWLALSLLLAALALGACGASPAAPADDSPTTAPAAGGSIQISDAWARPMALEMAAGEAPMAGMAEATPADGMATGDAHGGDTMHGGVNSAAYMVIRNGGTTADTLVAARTDAAETVELHTVVEENGVMQMRPVEGGIEIPAGGEVLLQPGGFHVMLIGLTRDLSAGETVELTLEFAQAGVISVTAEIRQR